MSFDRLTPRSSNTSVTIDTAESRTFVAGAIEAAHGGATRHESGFFMTVASQLIAGRDDDDAAPHASLHSLFNGADRECGRTPGGVSTHG
jgi:hypothetical protein